MHKVRNKEELMSVGTCQAAFSVRGCWLGAHLVKQQLWIFKVLSQGHGGKLPWKHENAHTVSFYLALRLLWNNLKQLAGNSDCCVCACREGSSCTECTGNDSVERRLAYMYSWASYYVALSPHHRILKMTWSTSALSVLSRNILSVDRPSTLTGIDVQCRACQARQQQNGAKLCVSLTPNWWLT